MQQTEVCEKSGVRLFSLCVWSRWSRVGKLSYTLCYLTYDMSNNAMLHEVEGVFLLKHIIYMGTFHLPPERASCGATHPVIGGTADPQALRTHSQVHLPCPSGVCLCDGRQASLTGYIYHPTRQSDTIED